MTGCLNVQLKNDLELLLRDLNCQDSLNGMKLPLKIGKSVNSLKLLNAAKVPLFSTGQQYDALKISDIALVNKNIGKGDTAGLGILKVKVERSSDAGGPKEFKSIERPMGVKLDKSRVITDYLCH